MYFHDRANVNTSTFHECQPQSSILLDHISMDFHLKKISTLSRKQANFYWELKGKGQGKNCLGRANWVSPVPPSLVTSAVYSVQI